MGIGSPVVHPEPGSVAVGPDRPVSLRAMFAHVAREVDDEAETVEWGPVTQRLAEPPPQPESTPDTTAEPSAPTTTAPVTTAPAAGAPLAPGMNIDDLANRLYEPIVTRIKTELWLDRERAGLLADPRI